MTLRYSRACWPLLLWALPLVAQTSQDVRLEIRFADGKTRFHVGETMPVELVFRAQVSGIYELGLPEWDRSGRIRADEFQVKPSGRDPLYNYYASARAIFGGGPSSSQRLGTEPRIVREDLNEWVALDRPGRYTLTVISDRVSRPDEREPLHVKSKAIAFEVVAADPRWQDGVVNSASMVLDDPQSTEQEKTKAIRELRFLDSPGSLRELATLLGKLPELKQWECIAGLAGTAHPDIAVRELEQEMIAPDAGITAGYLGTLATLKVQADRGPLPPPPGHDPEQQKLWNDRWEAQDAEFNQIKEALYLRTAELASMEEPSARAETIHTLLFGTVYPPGDAVIIQQRIASAFLGLSDDDQLSFLTNYWRWLKSPSMVSALSEIAQRSTILNGSLRDLALKRLYELDSREGRARILEEIQHPHVDNGGTVTAKTLDVLPDEKLPQFDDLLAHRLEQSNSPTRALDAQLAGRYATRAILPQVKAAYQKAPAWDCPTEDGFALYFVRMDPDYGIERVMQSPAFCVPNALEAVKRLNLWSELEPKLIAVLDNPDLNRARDVAGMLATHGSPIAEKAIWQRLRSFHDEWATREKDLTANPQLANEMMGLEGALIEALGHAQAWVLSGEEVTELEKLSFGPEQDNVRQWRWNSVVEVLINVISDEQVQANINHEYAVEGIASLTAKLAQYKSGTHLLLEPNGLPQQIAPVLAAVSTMAVERGLIIDQAK